MKAKVVLVATLLAIAFAVVGRAQDSSKEKVAADKGEAVAVLSVPGMT